VFISDFAIKRPLITVVSMVALVVFGLFSLWQLETDEFPDVQQPIINVAIPYPGASPDVVEREVLDRIEEAVSGISGVDRIMGSAQDGFANVTVFFLFEKDLQQASQDIRDKISSIRSDLPVEMKEPVLTRFDPADQPIVQLSLNSNTPSSNRASRFWRLPASWLCSTNIRISSGEWSRSASLGALIPRSRSRRLAVPLSTAIGPAITQANPISGAMTHELTASGKSRASAFGTSSPSTMCSTVMKMNAMLDATVWVAMPASGAGSHANAPWMRCASGWGSLR